MNCLVNCFMNYYLNLNKGQKEGSHWKDKKNRPIGRFF
jgi:hypothetical protein